MEKPNRRGSHVPKGAQTEVSGVLADIVIPSGLPAVQYFAVGLVVENPATPSAAAESAWGRRDATARPKRILPLDGLLASGCGLTRGKSTGSP